jgi:hypothetical protein
MPSNTEPHDIIRLEAPTRVDHTFSADGHFYLEIDHAFPEDAKPTTVRVTLTPDHIFGLLASLEATRQQFGFPLPAVFGQQQTRQ